MHDQENTTGSRSTENVNFPDEEADLRVLDSSNTHIPVSICAWIALSSLVIAFNKWILERAPYPILLTTWHLITASLLTQILALCSLLRFSDHRITPHKYIQAIVPIGVFYSFSLACGNIAYLHLSVSFIQMLKAMAPVAVLLTRLAIGLARPDLEVLFIVMLVAVGTTATTSSEALFSWVGFLYQSGAVVFEAVRVVLVEKLMGTREKMDPLVALYYYAPICAIINTALFIVFELPRVNLQEIVAVGAGVLLYNAAAAFLLNVSSVMVIGKSSSLVLSLSGILKTIIIVVGSVLFYGDTVSAIQVLGYSVALIGLIMYNVGFMQVLETSRNIRQAASSNPLVLIAIITTGISIGCMMVVYFQGVLLA
ncbi:TPT-domain-containing protein [Pseudovirgaria hyperparasitica]|uniref:TPT-domain-containing protein n=1 Tax=Pseudovirgaria hyperparasitica TaxID=470096 RepID=A0A6A6WM67_9PEZI|nr:TPT-domain-containing protein [Pseudovirgaria hyperparasitica]KAF2763252.1 TPT-domain-containing protein [Pseudovirgaria hyperparasitica]